MKTGLILEGGAMRAIYTAGVLDVFMEQGITFDGLLGVSAGAIHGSVYLGNQPGRTIRYYKKYSRHKNFMSFYSLLTTGSLVGEQFCYHDLPDRLDPFDYDTFAKSKTAYYPVCTELTTGKAIYPRCTDLRKEMDYLRASASMPLVSTIVEIGGQKLLDGGVADSIPVQAALELGYTRRVVVLTQPDGYVKKPMKMGPVKLLYRKYPAFIETMAHRHEVYNQTVELVRQLEQQGEILVIRPSRDLNISRMEKDPARLEEQYNLGRADGLAKLEELKEFLRG